jgi:hypothetical protein
MACGSKLSANNACNVNSTCSLRPATSRIALADEPRGEQGKSQGSYFSSPLRVTWKRLINRTVATFTAAYAVADEAALADLRDRLRRGVYEPLNKNLFSESIR